MKKVLSSEPAIVRFGKVFLKMGETCGAVRRDRAELFAQFKAVDKASSLLTPRNAAEKLSKS